MKRRSQSDPAALVTRAGGSGPELRGDRRLVFYAAVFDQEAVITEDGTRYREVIRRGAFAETLTAGVIDVYACIEHNRGGDRTFARQSSGLIVQEDPRGLFCSAYLPDDPAGNQVLADVRAGRYRGCSFGFKEVRQHTHPAPFDGLPLVERTAVELHEVTLTRTPFYPGTVLSVRAAAADVAGRRLRLLKLRATAGV